MGCLAVQSFWQVDNADGLERTPFDALTATDTHSFRNVADLTVLGNLDTLFALLVQWTNLGTLLCALIGLALVRIDDRNPQLIVAFHF